MCKFTSKFRINYEINERKIKMSNLKIAIAGTGYVGLSLAVLLAQNNHTVAVDVVPEKVEMINNRNSPIQPHRSSTPEQSRWLSSWCWNIILMPS